MGVTDDIKQRLNIVDVINENGVQLRKAGRNMTGFCPFHSNTRTPAFYVFNDTQSYYCFGCHASGDVFNFVMARQGLEFGDALRQLAAKAGVQLEERTPEREHEDATRAKLRQINEDAAVYWNHLLISTQRGERGRAYVEGRALSPATVEAWQIGYAPDDWSDLLRYLTDRKGYAPDELEQAGLIIKRESGGYYDRFRNRLMFPIRNAKGEVVGFGGRALGDDHAKYMNSPETPLFHKSSVLYGIDRARDAIRRDDALVLVEGYVDVLMAHQAGFANVVAPMGTALTSDQVGIIKKLTRNVYLALDADAAGTNATLKGLQILEQNADSFRIDQGDSFNPVAGRTRRGTFKIIELPDGRDPDDVIRTNPDEWRSLVAKAIPLMDYRMNWYIRDLDLSSIEDRRVAVQRLVPLIGELADPLDRALRTQQLAEKVELAESDIRDAVGRARRIRPEIRQKDARLNQTIPVSHSPTFSREDELLSLLLRFPHALGAVESELSKDLAQFPELTSDIRGSVAETLTHIENQQVWHTWLQAAQDGAVQSATWLDALDPYLNAHAQRLLTYQDVPELPLISRPVHAAERASKIAQELRKSVVIQRKKQLLSIYESVDDQIEQRLLVQRLDYLNQYQNTVTAPRRSQTYTDLGSRLDQLK